MMISIPKSLNRIGRGGIIQKLLCVAISPRIGSHCLRCQVIYDREKHPAHWQVDFNARLQAAHGGAPIRAKDSDAGHARLAKS